MVMLTSDVVMRRLQDISAPTQEAIETMSLWIMHYKDKASIDVIVEGWLNSFRIATQDQKRIALFYVMNDVVQKAKNKHIDALIPAFQPAVLTVVGVGRKYEKVKAVMKRCIAIFKQRQVFTQASITAMENLLDADDTYDAEETVLDIDVEDIVKKISVFVSARNVVSAIMKNVNEGDFNYREKIQTSMKDREEGAHVLQEVHEAIDTMVQVRHSMEAQKKKMVEMVETLELAKRVYMHQKREVLVVEEAYINFRDGIKAVHSELIDMEQTGVYPGVTPPREAPSPTPEDDIYATGVENVIQHFRAPETWDNRQPMDMEMDDEDKPLAPIPKPTSTGFPPPGLIMQPSLQSRIDQLGLKHLAEGIEHNPNATEKAKTGQMSSIPDFSKPPPVFGMASVSASQESNMNAFGVPMNATAPTTTIPSSMIAGVTISRSEQTNIQEILKTLSSVQQSSKQVGAETTPGKTSIYQMALQQQGIRPSMSSDVDERASQQQAAMKQLYVAPPPAAQYQMVSPTGSAISPPAQQLISPGGYTELRDPRIAANSIPQASAAYQMNYDMRGGPSSSSTSVQSNPPPFHSGPYEQRELHGSPTKDHWVGREERRSFDGGDRGRGSYEQNRGASRFDDNRSSSFSHGRSGGFQRDSRGSYPRGGGDRPWRGNDRGGYRGGGGGGGGRGGSDWRGSGGGQRGSYGTGGNRY